MLFYSRQKTLNNQSIIATGKYVRDKCMLFKKNKKNTNISLTSSMDDVNPELYTLVRCILTGSSKILPNVYRENCVHRQVLMMCQTMMFNI